MNYIDIIMLIPIAWFGFKGFKNGLINELASIAALLLGTWAAIKFSGLVASWLGESVTVQIVAFVIIFVGVLLLVHLAGKMVEKIIKLVIPGSINHFFGLVFSVLKVTLIFSILFFLINSVDKKEMILKPAIKEKSLLYPFVEPLAPSILPHFKYS